jgi:trans-aconitate methyltransferase
MAILVKLRSSLACLIKKLDRALNYKFGNYLREKTNPNRPKEWDIFYSKYTEFFRDFPYPLLIKFLPQDNNFSLLDVGCGMGDGCQLMQKHFPGAQIEGADFSSLAIAKAIEKKTGVKFFVLDIMNEDPPRKYDFISLVHTLEHFNDPFPVLEKCLKFVNKAVFVVTPYVKKIDEPRLYWRGLHRYLFNENTFSKYKCSIMEITTELSPAGYLCIVYKIEP